MATPPISLRFESTSKPFWLILPLAHCPLVLLGIVLPLDQALAPDDHAIQAIGRLRTGCVEIVATFRQAGIDAVGIVT